jgi:hypothetical protein
MFAENIHVKEIFSIILVKITQCFKNLTGGTPDMAIGSRDNRFERFNRY